MPPPVFWWGIEREQNQKIGLKVYMKITVKEYLTIEFRFSCVEMVSHSIKNYY